MSSSKSSNILRNVIPWLIAAALLWWLFQRYPLQDVMAAAQHVSLSALVLFLVAYFTWFNFFDIWSLHHTLAASGIRGKLRDVMKIRFASNFAMILNYGLGQGVMAYLIKRSFGESFLRVGGVLALIVVTDLLLGLSISFVGTFFTDVVVGGINLVPWIRLAWVGLILGVILVVVLWRAPLQGDRWNWFKSGRLFHALNTLTLADFAALALKRLPLAVVACSYLWFLALCFGVSVPLEKVLVLLPLTIIVGAIPITPSGLGTVQITTVYLFQGFVGGPAIDSGQISPAEVLLAMSLLFTLGMYVLKLLTGAMFFRTVMKSVQSL